MRALLHLSCALCFASTVVAQGAVRVVDNGQLDYGALWQLDVAADGTLESTLEISDRAGTFVDRLGDWDAFGSSIASLGDLDGNGAVDLAVGAPGNDLDGLDRGAVWIVFRELDGTVASARAIRSGKEGLGVVADREKFGTAVAAVGDLDQDGVVDLAVGAPGSTGSTAGSVRILFLRANGTVAVERRIGVSSGGFTGTLAPGDRFGHALSALGDLDGDGVPEVAVGAHNDDALWILYLNSDGTVKTQRKIGPGSGGFVGPAGEKFGSSVTALGDLNLDGQLDLAVGAEESDDGGVDRGAIWILFLDSTETVVAQQKISATQGGLGSNLFQHFGCSVDALGDFDGDGTPDVAVGARSIGRGGLYLLTLAPSGTVETKKLFSSNVPGLSFSDAFGAAVEVLGDLDFDGRVDLAVGSSLRDGLVLPADYVQIQPAVNAAVDGDVVLVRSGSYGAVALVSKGITLHAETDSAVMVPSLEVRDVSAAQAVFVRGLLCGPGTLRDSDGAIGIEDCRFSNGSQDVAPLVIDNGTAVLLHRTRAAATDPSNIQPAPSVPRGLEIRGGSNVRAFDGEFRGCDAGGDWDCSGFPVCAQSPGAGIVLESANDRLYLSGCSAFGGHGRDSPLFGGSPDCTPGAAGLLSHGQSSVLDSDLQGGAGADGAVPCSAGPQYSGDVTLLAGRATHLAVASPVRERAPVAIEFQGPPHTPVWLTTLPRPSNLFFPWSGSVLAAGPGTLELVGITDGDGRLSTSFAAPALPVGVQSELFLIRAYESWSPDPALPSSRLRRNDGSRPQAPASLLLVLDESL